MVSSISRRSARWNSQRVVATGVLVVATLTAVACTDDLNDGPLDGKWVFESQVIGGEEVPRDRLADIWIEVEGDTFARCGTGGLRLQYRLMLDPLKDPARFDLTFKHPVTGTVTRTTGIYRLDRNKLILCYDNTGQSRPAGFESPVGRDEIVFSVLRRSKK